MTANASANARKRERHRQALDQRGGDRAVEQDRLPEIAAQHAPVPIGHLQRQRLVEPERDAQARDLLGRGARVQEGRCRIARHQPDHGKRHQRHEQQDDRGAGEPPYQETSHSSCPDRASGVRLRARSPTCAESGRARSSSASRSRPGISRSFRPSSPPRRRTGASGTDRTAPCACPRRARARRAAAISSIFASFAPPSDRPATHGAITDAGPS